MALSTADAARLASLQAAYDKLIAGSAVASVASGDKKVDYAKGDVATLKAEIDSLNAKAAASCGRTRGAVRFQIR